MKAFALTVSLFLFGVSGFAQIYKPIVSTNKTYRETLKGVSYTYKDGVVTLKNNGKFDLGTVSIIAESKSDPSLFGIALFEDGVYRNKVYKMSVYFTSSAKKNDDEVPLKAIDQPNLIFSFDKATRAMP
ncbi:hypothetical protein [Pedobacter sp. Leaf194]|uniref:hypothetical protein n=1 Tax=Pedobacter sp. Leaf194 TaxID=1736297 RepID=UPI000702DEE8|nr:hypothetical protein [Pedobacter sp. Leaf194]KQS36308.1 hypothetical protein ASG14_12875 [Pedobacter sp. Leaf194]